MPDLANLIADRDTAGAAYASAVAALKTAWINLYALDFAINNNNVGGHDRVKTFGNGGITGGHIYGLEHPDYAATEFMGGTHQDALVDAGRAAGETLIRQFDGVHE